MPKRIYVGMFLDETTGEEVFSFEIPEVAYQQMADAKTGSTKLTVNLLKGSTDEELISSLFKDP